MVVRINNVVIPEKKNIRVALASIYGIGKRYGKKTRAQLILAKLGINHHTKVKDLTDQQINAINQEIKQFDIEGDLRQKTEQNIQEKIRINCWQGICHSMGKKVRGQATRHNNRNRPQGIKTITKRPIAIAGKKKAPKQG